MKKNRTRRSRSHLQSLDAAQLAQVSGGVSAVEYYPVIAAMTAAVLDLFVR